MRRRISPLRSARRRHSTFHQSPRYHAILSGECSPTADRENIQFIRQFTSCADQSQPLKSSCWDINPQQEPSRAVPSRTACGGTCQRFVNNPWAGVSCGWRLHVSFVSFWRKSRRYCRRDTSVFARDLFGSLRFSCIWRSRNGSAQGILDVKFPRLFRHFYWLSINNPAGLIVKGTGLTASLFQVGSNWVGTMPIATRARQRAI